MDLLTDILQGFHLQSTALYRGCVTAPWGISFAPRDRHGADAGFHVVTEGKCLFQLAGKDAPFVPLHVGDFVLLPHGAAHSLRDAPGTPVYPIEMLRRPGDTDADGVTRFGADGVCTRVACGRFVWEDGATNPFLQGLPELIVVRGEQGRALPWLETTLSFLACESASDRPGAATVIARLCDILFIHAVRAHLEEMPPCARGWLAALRDPDLAPVLRAVHARPGNAWTVETMAREAGMSRSAFAQRFCAVMGEPPLHYLTGWRVHVAAGLLKTSNLPLIEVASRVGYETEAAFSKVFKSRTGVAPGGFRRHCHSAAK